MKGFENYDGVEPSNSSNSKDNVDMLKQQASSHNQNGDSTSSKITQNPYYGNDSFNESSNSTITEPVVIINNPYYK